MAKLSQMEPGCLHRQGDLSYANSACATTEKVFATMEHAVHAYMSLSVVLSHATGSFRSQTIAKAPFLCSYKIGVTRQTLYSTPAVPIYSILVFTTVMGHVTAAAMPLETPPDRKAWAADS